MKPNVLASLPLEIMEYIRDRKGRHIGLILARNDNGLIRLGWSQTNRKEGDKFDLETGLAWARARMIQPVRIPDHIMSQYEKMEKRAKTYFKNAIPIWENKVTAFKTAPFPVPKLSWNEIFPAGSPLQKKMDFRLKDFVQHYADHGNGIKLPKSVKIYRKEIKTPVGTALKKVKLVR